MKEVAQMMGVHYATAYDYVAKKLKNAAGEPIPVVRLGRHIIRIPKKRFHKWAGLD